MKVHPFDQYSAFTDVSKLRDFSSKPLRKSLRVNTLKSSVDAFKAWTKAKNWTIEPVPWCPEGFFIDRVDREEALGKDLLHILGHTYMQEASSMLPVSLLQPKAGDNVLDMSAAPGSKTTQIADALQGRGVIIANDVQEKRLWSLASNLQRCSVMNVAITRKVGQWFAKHMTGRFDCVLCDAPCTAQGTVRKDSDALEYCSLENTGRMAKLQKELLESAVHAAKVGGRIVYSTCTLTPDENENVVRFILEKFPEQLEVIDPLGEEFGIKNQELRIAVEDSLKVQRECKFPALFPCVRVWPQAYNTEGFFAALIHKKVPTRDRTVVEQFTPLHSSVVPGSRQKAYRNSLTDWYGTQFFSKDELLFESKDKLWITTQAVADFKLPVKPYLVGMPFGRAINQELCRVSQEILTLRGREVMSQRVEVSESELRQLLKGQNVKPWQGSAKDGDVILFLDGIPICRGLQKNGEVLNRLPREIVAMYT